MGVYIKGMEMPKNCLLCPLSVMNGERVYCEVTKDEVLRAKIAQDCPLIELPPHGRLIDADVLKELYDLGEELDYCHVKLPVIRLNIDDMPTILEAEVEE